MPRKVVVVVNGYPRAGKDSAIKFAMADLRAKSWRSVAISSIDPVRHMLRDLGIPVENKTPAERNLMAEVKSALERYDWWATRLTAKQVQSWLVCVEGPGLCFVQIREVAAIKKLRELLDPEIEFHTLVVTSPREERGISNVADTDVENMAYDLSIINDGTLNDLRHKCGELVDYLIAEPVK